MSGTYDQNIYSTFVENKTVCAGYTRGIQYLMMKRGVPCYYCVGEMYSEEEQDWIYHSWNVIKLNGNYHNCDLTWDDFYNEFNRYPFYISYEHFNTSDAQYIIDGENNLGRLRIIDGSLLPTCNADDMNYKALYGTEWEYDVVGQLGLDGTYMIDSAESYFDFLYSQAINRGIGNHSLTFIIKGSDTIEQIGNLSTDEYVYHLIDPVEGYLGRSGWSGINCQSQYYPLWPFDEYFYMECQLNFSNEEEQSECFVRIVGSRCLKMQSFATIAAQRKAVMPHRVTRIHLKSIHSRSSVHNSGSRTNRLTRKP